MVANVNFIESRNNAEIEYLQNKQEEGIEAKYNIIEEIVKLLYKQNVAMREIF